MYIKDNINWGDIKKLLIEQGRIVTLEGFKTAIFVGCVHSDTNAMRWLKDRYSACPDTATVLISDLFDRGSFQSGMECLNIALEWMLETQNIFMIASNHLMYHHVPFQPCEWWLGLSDRQYRDFVEIFDRLAFCVSTRGLVALHGLPVKNLQDANDIEIGSSDWLEIVWGRLVGPYAPDKNYMDSILNEFTVCIRSHDHYGAPLWYSNSTGSGGSILTITTSKNLLNTKRLVAEVSLEADIITKKDVRIIDLDEMVQDNG